MSHTPPTGFQHALRSPPRVLLTESVVIAGSFLLAACGSDDDAPQTELRVIHASPDAPKVNVLLDGDAVLTEVDYKGGSGLETLDRGTYDITVDAITPGGEATVITVNDAVLDADTDYTVLAIGKVASSTLAPLLIANPDTAVTSGQARRHHRQRRFQQPALRRGRVPLAHRLRERAAGDLQHQGGG